MIITFKKSQKKGVKLLQIQKRLESRLKKSSRFLRNHFVSFILGVLLIIILSLIVYYRLKIQMIIGPSWDTCDFLANAFEFAGKGYGYSDLERPPLLSFLASIFIRLGYESEVTIYAVDGFLYIFGVIGLYLLYKLRFNSINSFLGSLLFATIPVVLLFVSLGLSDVPSVSFSIWAIYFTILAVKTDSKFFYLSFPFALLAFLTRYSAALIVFPIFLYILINRHKIKNFKDMLIGIFTSFLLTIPLISFYYIKFGNSFQPFLSFYSTTGASVSPENVVYNPDLLFYIVNLPYLLGIVPITLILIILLGIIVCIVRFRMWEVFKNNLNNRKNNIKNIFKLDGTGSKIKVIILIILILIFVVTFGSAAYMLSEILFFAICYLSYNLLKKLEVNDMDINVLFLSWLMTYFIFNSVYAIKVDRYFVAMAPAFCYFLIMGWSEISEKLELKLRKINLTSYILSIGLLFMMLSFAGFYLPTLTQSNYNIIYENENVESACHWLKNYDPDYENKIICSNIWPYTAWYLRTNVNKMPIYKDNNTFYSGGLKNYNFTPADNFAVNQELEKNNADYYFSYYYLSQKFNLSSYKLIKRFGNIVIYEKINKI